MWPRAAKIRWRGSWRSPAGCCRLKLLKDEVVWRPPILLVHGDADDVVPPQSLPQAAEALQEAGWQDVYAHIMKGTGHGIAPDGLRWRWPSCATSWGCRRLINATGMA